MVNIVEKIIDTYHIRKLFFNVLCLEVRSLKILKWMTAIVKHLIKIWIFNSGSMLFQNMGDLVSTNSDDDIWKICHTFNDVINTGLCDLKSKNEYINIWLVPINMIKDTYQVYFFQSNNEISCRRNQIILVNSWLTSTIDFLNSRLLGFLEEMEAQDICEWLKNESGKPFEESVLTAIEGKHKWTCLVLHAVAT